MFFLISFLFALLFHPFSSFAASKTAQAPAEVFPEQSKDDILYSDQFFYTATRSVQPIKRVTDNVTVITREEIDRWPVSDLDEALGLISGIVVQDSGHIGQTATAQIFGSKPREVRVMIDGIPFNATTTGGIADLSQIPLDLVQKIEVIKGASSSVWGSAMGGVINIITRPVGKNLVPHGSGSLSFGEFNTHRERGEVSGAVGPLHYYGFGSNVESGGFRPNSDELEKRSFGKVALPLTDNLSFKGSFGYSGSKVSEFDLADVGLSQKRKVFSRYGNAGLSHNWNDRVQSDFFYKISERTFRRDRNLFPSGDFFQLSKAQSILHEASFQSLVNVTQNQTLVFGTDIDVDVYHDAVFRATTTRADVNKESTEHAYYANYQLSWWQFDFTAGSRLDATNSYGVNFDPSVGMVFNMPVLRSLFRANVERTFNAPSLVDRYLSAGTTISNPDLNAEHAIAYNLGPEFDPFKGVHGKATFFQTFLDDSIETILRSDGLFQPVNLSKERRTGFQTECKLGPWHGFSTTYDVAYVKATTASGVPLLSRPRMTHDIKLNQAVEVYVTQWNFNLTARHTDLVGYSGFTDPADQMFIFDGKIILKLPKIFYGNFSLFLIGKNLFNGEFSFDSVRAPLPGRNFEAGVQYSF